MKRLLLFIALASVLVAIPASAATVCQTFNGCTGTSTSPAYGQLLIGGKNGEYEYIASSTLKSAGGSGFSTTSAAYWFTQQTTSGLAEGSNLYFTNARAVSALTGQNVSIFTNDAGYLTPTTFATDFDTRLSGTTSLPNITTLADLSLPYAQLTGTPNLSIYFPLSTWYATTSAPQLNAGTATKLQNARTINGVSFDGSANITVNAASSTALSDNNTFSGANTFSSGTTTIANDNTTLWVPANFATAGCAGNVLYTDLGLCVNGLVALAHSWGYPAAQIAIPDITVPAANWQDEINPNISNFIYSIDCVRGATLIYGGTGTSTLFNMANPTGHIVSDDYGCQYQGNSSLIAAGQTNSKTTVGIGFGGNYGAVGINFHDNTVNGYGKDLQIGANAYMLTIADNAISGGNCGASNPGCLLYIDVASNSGEANSFPGDDWTDPGNSYATSSIYISNGATASNVFSGTGGSCSFDDVGMYIGTADGLTTVDGCHVENSDYSQYGMYVPFVGSSSQYTSINLQNIFVADDANSAATTFQYIIHHGNNLYAAGIFIDMYGGQTISAFSDHDLNNGSESEEICQIQAVGGTLTNIVGGSGAQAYSEAAGATCTSDVANSYTVSMFNNSNNVADIRNGNQNVATFDNNGNWTFGGASGNTTLVGTLTEDGSGTSTFSGGISTFKTINVQSTTASSTFANGINISAGCFSVGGSCLSSGGGGTVTGVTGTWPILSSGGTAPVISWGGISTSTNLVPGDLDYATGANTIGQVGTTTQTFSGPFSLSATQGYLVGGSNATITWTGLSTTSQPADSQLLESNGATGVFGVATSTLTPSSPLGGSFTVVGSGGTLTCTTCVTSVSGTTNQVTSSGGTAPTLSLPNLVIFPSAASTTLLSVSNTAYFGGTATTTIDKAGNIVIPSGSSLTNTGVSNGCGTWTSGVLGSTGSACAAGTLTSIATNNGITGGTITTSGTIGLATIAANSVLANQTSASAVPTALATSSLYTFTGSGLSVLSNAPTFTGTVNFSAITISTTLTIPSSSNPSPTAAGSLAQSTNSPYQLQIGNGNSGTAVFDPRVSFTFGTATSTNWTGSTTAPVVPVPTGLTWTQIACTVQPTGATLDVQYQYGNGTGFVFPSMVAASSTQGVFKWTTNNTPATNASSTITFGTPTGSPTSIGCTLTGTITGT